jgi:DNA-binding transcriptional LysR family regulator
VTAGLERVGDSDLRLVVSAARHGTFTGAATEAGIGQSAVSHAIARVERALGARLFERRSSGVALTEIGRRLTDELEAAFDRVDRALDGVRESRQEAATLSVSTSLAALWLMPRLAGFKRDHPDVEISCHTNDTDRGVGRDDADVWIPLGRGPWPGLHARRFCDEVLVLVGAPALVEQWSTAPFEHLVDAPLLHLDQRFRPRFDWYQWFDHFSVPRPRRLPGYRSNDYSLIIQAATEGQGLAIGWLHLVDDLIADGRLARLGSLSVATDHPFVVLTRTEHPGTAAASLVEWLLASAPTPLDMR